VTVAWSRRVSGKNFGGKKSEETKNRAKIFARNSAADILLLISRRNKNFASEN